MGYRDRPLEQRQEESTRVLNRYPDKVCLIVRQLDKSETKYLVPRKMPIGDFLQEIRNRNQVNSRQAIFLLSEKGHIYPGSHNIGEIYERDREVDNFLYLQVRTENTFGKN